MVPFNIFLKLKIGGLEIKGYFKLTWIKIRLFQREFPDKNKGDNEKKEIKEENKKQKFDFRRLPQIISLLYESSSHLIRVFNAFLKSTYFEKLSLNLTLGLGDPVNTAMISGYLWAAASLLNTIPKANLSIEPDFLNERVEGNIIIKIRVRLFWIVIESLRAFTKKPVRSLLNEIRKMR